MEKIIAEGYNNSIVKVMKCRFSQVTFAVNRHV